MTAPSREPTEAMRLLASQLLRCNCGAESGYEESGAPIIHDGRCAVRYRLAVARALAEQDTAARLAGFAEARELAELVVIRGGGQPS